MYFIPQITQNDCLFTSMKMLLANIKNDKNYLYLKEDESHSSYSYYEIIELSKSYGVELTGFSVEDKKELIKADNDPMILTIDNGNGLHAIYVYKINKSYVKYYDPQLGFKKVRMSYFLSIWNGTGLLVKEIIETNVDFPKDESLKYRKQPLFSFLQLLSGLIFLAGFFLIGYVDLKFIPYIFFVGGAIVEVISRTVLLQKIKQFDKDNISRLETLEPKYYHEFLVRKEKYKESMFSSKNNLLYYLIICSFIVFTIILSNPLNVLCVFIPVVLSIFQSLTLSDLEKNFSDGIEQKEVNLKSTKNVEKAKKLYNEIHVGSYKFITFVSLKKVIGVIIFGVSTLFTLSFYNDLSFVNFIFLLFTQIYLYQNLVCVLTYEPRQSEKEYNYMRYINLLNKKS